MGTINPHQSFDKKFAKVVITTSMGDKALKGVIEIIGEYVLVKGDYQNTNIHYSEIIRITTKN